MRQILVVHCGRPLMADVGDLKHPTKAVSWLHRSLTAHAAQPVQFDNSSDDCKDLMILN